MLANGNILDSTCPLLRKKSFIQVFVKKRLAPRTVENSRGLGGRHGGCNIYLALDCVPKHSHHEGESVGTSRRQFLLAFALIAAAMILGGVPARAGYVSVAKLAEQDGVGILGFLSERDTSVTTGSAGDSASPQPDDDPSNPAPPTPLSLQVHPAVCNFGNSSTGSSSHSAPGAGSSSLPAGDLPRPQLPPLQPTSFLPPQTGDAHSFCVTSFLFRPPRAA